MHIVELFSGFGLGGAEIASVSRLPYAPSDVRTTFVVAKRRPSSLDLPNDGETTRIYCPPGISSVTEVISSLSPDIVLINSPRHVVGFGLAGRKLPTAQMVVVAHNEVVSDSRLFNPAVARMLRVVNPRFNHHIAVSSQVASGQWCAGARDVRVSPLGATLAPPGLTPEVTWPIGTELRLLALSRLTSQKNLPALIRAMIDLAPGLRRRKAHLRIVGDGSQASKLELLVARSGVADLVTLLGRTDVPGDWLRQTDWLLIPSLAEGGPLTLYEGLQAGARVMATPCGASREALKGDRQSVLTGGFGASHLAEGLLRVLAENNPVPEVERLERALRGGEWSTGKCATRWYGLLSSLG